VLRSSSNIIHAIDFLVQQRPIDTEAIAIEASHIPCEGQSHVEDIWRHICSHLSPALVDEIDRIAFQRALNQVAVPFLEKSSTAWWRLYEKDDRSFTMLLDGNIYKTLQRGHHNKVSIPAGGARKVALPGAYLANTRWTPGACLKDSVFSGANLSRSNFSQGNLLGADMEGANLKFSILTEALLERVNLTGVDLTHADLQRARLVGAILSKAVLKNTNLTGSYPVMANFTQANLEGACFDDSKLFSSDFERATLAQATFVDADARSTNFCDANLERVDLNGVQFQCANLSRAYLVEAKLIGANLKSSRFINADLTRADLRGAHMKGANFSGSILNGARINRSALEEVSFDDSNTKGMIISL